MADNKKSSILLARIHAFGEVVYRWLGSAQFFYIVVAIFAFQALWIALSARYPQAFDENYHFGLIQLHAQQWLPFFTSHPPNAEVYGPVSRDPSYFYHFLLSLPYRLLTHITSNVTAQVIVLRIINIGLFIWGLFVYRRLMDALAIGRRLRNVAFLFFVLTPVVVQLAPQLNYDNLIFPLTGLLFLYTVCYLKALQETGHIHVRLLLEILLWGVFAGIVKYTSLPIFLAIIVIVLVPTLKVLMGGSQPLRKLCIAPERRLLLVYILLLIVLGGLFVERYGINMIRFHSPAPACSAVLTVEQCQSYAPWARDYMFKQTLPNPSALGLVTYPFVWVHRMVFETMFLISSHFNDQGQVDYVATPPLTVANYTAWAVVAAGTILLVVYWRRLWRMTHLRVLLLAIAFYAAILFLKNYAEYFHVGEAVSIHGRYLVPVYPVLYVTLALGFAWLFRRVRATQYQSLLVVLTLVFFLQGGGLVAWLYRSDPTWYWSDNPNSTVYKVNSTAQNVVRHVVVP